MKDKLVYIAILVSIVTYQFWIYLPKGSFYIGMALFVFVLSYILFLQNKAKFPYFLLLCLSINNLLDELFFDATKMGWNEVISAILIPIFYHARKIHKQ